jgi:hypothetical protein
MGLVIENSQSEKYVPCFTHGDFVRIKSLDADHATDKDSILRKQVNLINEINENDATKKLALNLDRDKKFFIEMNNGQIKGSKLYYEIYINCVDNLWLICHECNNTKRNQDFLTWLGNNWLFGEEFLEYINQIGNQNSGFIDTSDNIGLAKRAIE